MFYCLIDKNHNTIKNINVYFSLKNDAILNSCGIFKVKPFKYKSLTCYALTDYDGSIVFEYIQTKKPIEAGELSYEFI